VIRLKARYWIRPAGWFCLGGKCGVGVNLVEIASSTFEGSATGAAVELIIFYLLLIIVLIPSAMLRIALRSNLGWLWG